MSAILEHTLAPAERRVVTEFANRVRARFGSRLARVILFGSRARGDVTEESDIGDSRPTATSPTTRHRSP